MKKTKLCCEKKSKESKGLLSGVIYGLIPHTGCIAFIAFTVLGVTTATAFLKPLLLNAYFFYILIGLSFIFATISATIYLKKNEMLSMEGIKNKWKYLSVLYGTTITVNILLFLFIFPLAANMTSAAPTGYAITNEPQITLKVDIPCPGHAPLISEELKKLQGVSSIKFRFPNYFDVIYNPYQTSQDEILSLGVFKTYKAVIVEREEIQTAQNPIGETPIGYNGCTGCTGSCGI